jgi:hypothetical protein
MNSVQKQYLDKTENSPDELVIGFEKFLMSLPDFLEVEVVMKKLQFLGIHFDPFQDVMGKECEQIVEQLGLKNQLQDPYLFTNTLLRLLDKTEERMNNLKQ